MTLRPRGGRAGGAQRSLTDGPEEDSPGQSLTVAPGQAPDPPPALLQKTTPHTYTEANSETPNPICPPSRVQPRGAGTWGQQAPPGQGPPATNTSHSQWHSPGDGTAQSRRPGCWTTEISTLHPVHRGKLRQRDGGAIVKAHRPGGSFLHLCQGADTNPPQIGPQQPQESSS